MITRSVFRISIRVITFFWNHINKTSSCWEWTGYKNEKGYGIVTTDGMDIRTHRLSWMLHHGSIHPQKQVLHKCDNPGCVNPDHLFIGTNKINHEDKIRKNRQYKKLSDEEAITVYNLYHQSGLDLDYIRSKYPQVTKGQIVNIAQGKRLCLNALKTRREANADTHGAELNV